MTAETLITTATAFIGVFLATAVVTIPTIISLLGNSRRDLASLVLKGPKSGYDNLQWKGFINKQLEIQKNLKKLLYEKTRLFVIFVLMFVFLGVIIPSSFDSSSISFSWYIFTDKTIYLLFLLIIIGYYIGWVRATIKGIVKFENANAKDWEALINNLGNGEQE